MSEIKTAYNPRTKRTIKYRKLKNGKTRIIKG